MVRPILLLEINEIPWKMVDRYSGTCPSLREFISRASTFTTIAADKGELSPWITWPTLHRGMPSERHQIKFLGQDPSSFLGTPIWDEFRNRGLSIGVCGSLQSWPPKDPGPHGFYIPDTFAASAACIPKWVEPFQALNLRLVSENSRVVSAKLPLHLGAIRFALTWPRLGIKPRTIFKTLLQLLRERFSSHYLARRPVFQAIFQWDIFTKLYNPENPPAFASFFTNHVASLMHRYWQEEFPEDFPGHLRDSNHQKAIAFSMKVLDQFIVQALKFQERNHELILVIASSMGQEAKAWKGFEGHSALIADVRKLLLALVPGISSKDLDSVIPLLAMAPQKALKVEDEDLRSQLLVALSQCFSSSGLSLFSATEEGNRISITMSTPPLQDLKAGEFLCRAPQMRQIPWHSAGIEIQRVSPASAYHMPEGVLAILDLRQEPDSSRVEICASEVKAKLLALSGTA